MINPNNMAEQMVPGDDVSSAIRADVRRQIAELRQQQVDGRMPQGYLDMELAHYAAYFGPDILKTH